MDGMGGPGRLRKKEEVGVTLVSVVSVEVRSRIGEERQIALEGD